MELEKNGRHSRKRLHEVSIYGEAPAETRPVSEVIESALEAM